MVVLGESTATAEATKSADDPPNTNVDGDDKPKAAPDKGGADDSKKEQPETDSGGANDKPGDSHEDETAVGSDSANDDAEPDTEATSVNHAEEPTTAADSDSVPTIPVEESAATPKDKDGPHWVTLQNFMRSALTRRTIAAQQEAIVTLQSFARAKLARLSAQEPDTESKAPPQEVQAVESKSDDVVRADSASETNESSQRQRIHEPTNTESKQDHAAHDGPQKGRHSHHGHHHHHHGHGDHSRKHKHLSEEEKAKAAADAREKENRRWKKHAQASHKRTEVTGKKSIHSWKERERRLKEEQKEQAKAQAERLRKAKEYARKTKELRKRQKQSSAAMLAAAETKMDPNSFSSYKYSKLRALQQERVQDRENRMHLKLQEEMAVAEDRLRQREQQKIAAKKLQLQLTMERREARERDLAQRKALLKAERKKKAARQMSQKKPLFMRMEEHYQYNILSKEEAERQRRLNSRKAKLKPVSLDEIREHQRLHAREIAAKDDQKKKQRLQQTVFDADIDNAFYRGKHFARIQQEHEEKQMAALGPKLRKQKIQQYSDLVREMYKPQISPEKANEVASRRRKLNPEGPRRRAQVDRKAEKEKYRGAWREVNPLASKPARPSWEVERQLAMQKEEERLERQRRAREEANERMMRFNREAAMRRHANDDVSNAYSHHSEPMATANLRIDDEDQNAQQILNKLRRLNSLTQY